VDGRDGGFGFAPNVRSWKRRSRRVPDLDPAAFSGAVDGVDLPPGFRPVHQRHVLFNSYTFVLLFCPLSVLG